MKTLVGILIFIVWTIISAQWYVCGIKELCKAEKSAKVEPEKKIITEKVIIDTNKVHFDFESISIYFPYAESETVLSESLKDSIILFANNIMKTEKFVLLVGNTDNIGSNENNNKLGLERATWVQDIFISNGLKQNKIEIMSNGETQPVINNNNKINRSKNRRVEVSIKPLN